MIIDVFSYPQVTHVTLDDFNSGDLFMITSRHSMNPLIKVFRHTDQQLDFLIKNIDRKPVLLNRGDIVSLLIFDSTNREIHRQELETMNFDKGHMAVMLSRHDTGKFPLGNNYSWCLLLENEADCIKRILYSDRDYGGHSPMRVLEGPKPDRPNVITIDTSRLTNGLTGALAGAAQTINTSGVHTILLKMEEYTGLVRMEATLDVDIPRHADEWTQVFEEDFSIVTEERLFNIVGNYQWVRFYFSAIDGVEAKYRNL